MKMKPKSKNESHYKVQIARIADTEGPEKNLPDKIYHYCSLETGIEKILPFKRLLLSPLENTNDPRENRTFQFSAISPPNQIDFTSNNWPERVTNLLREDCKVICFSTNNNNQFGYEYSRMWAYYGSNHKGFCLELDTQKFIEENTNVVDLRFLKRVEYLKLDLKKPLKTKWVDFGRLDDIGLSKYLKEEFRQDHLKYLYFTKDYEWESEKECRLIYFSDIKEDEYCSINMSLTGIYTGVDFHQSYIPSLKELAPDINLYRMYYPLFRLIATPI